MSIGIETIGVTGPCIKFGTKDKIIDGEYKIMKASSVNHDAFVIFVFATFALVANMEFVCLILQ